MKRAYWRIIALALAALAAVIVFHVTCSYLVVREARACFEYRIIFHEVYVASKPIELGALLEDLPESNEYQELLGFEVLVNGSPWTNYTVLETPNGKALLILGVPKLNAGEELEVEVRCRVKAWPRPQLALDPRAAGGYDEIPANISWLTEPTSLWNYTHPTLKSIVEEVHGRTPLETLLNALRWIKSHVKVEERPGIAKPPWRVVEEGTGDCDDLSNLLITLLRGNGVPAFMAYGLSWTPGSKLNVSLAKGYQLLWKGCWWHAWVEAYIPPWGWVAVDPTMPTPIECITSAPASTGTVVVMGRYVQMNYAKAAEEVVKETREAGVSYVGETMMEGRAVLEGRTSMLDLTLAGLVGATTGVGVALAVCWATGRWRRG